MQDNFDGSMNGIDNNRTFIDDEDKNNTTTTIRATYTNHRLSQSVLASAQKKCEENASVRRIEWPKLCLVGTIRSCSA